MVSFVGFHESKSFNQLTTGRWYAYLSERDGPVLILAAESESNTLAVRFKLSDDPEEPARVDLIDRALSETPAVDVTDRLIISVAAGSNPFGLPDLNSRAVVRGLVSAKGKVAVGLDTQMGKFIMINLGTGREDGFAWEASHPAWSIRSRSDDGRELLIASIVGGKNA